MKTPIILIALFSLCFSTTVSITGTVTDTNSLPIQGAIVSLSVSKLTTTTDINGNFAFAYVNVKQTINQSKASSLKVNLNKDLRVSAYSLNGRTINKPVSSGCFIKINTVRPVFFTTSEQHASAVVFKDTVVVKKTGYWNSRNPIATSTVTGMNIKLYSTVNSIMDTNGNVYGTVTIGTQTWTTSNYRGTTNGFLVTDSLTWAKANYAAYCSYNNTTNQDSIKKYGLLYNQWAVHTLKVPKGWHVPSDTEWTALYNYLKPKGISVAQGADSGLNIKYAGFRMVSPPSAAEFRGIGSSFRFWSSTPDGGVEYSYVGIFGNNVADTLVNGMTIGRTDINQSGFSVRLIKD